MARNLGFPGGGLQPSEWHGTVVARRGPKTKNHAIFTHFSLDERRRSGAHNLLGIKVENKMIFFSVLQTLFYT